MIINILTLKFSYRRYVDVVLEGNRGNSRKKITIFRPEITKKRPELATGEPIANSGR